MKPVAIQPTPYQLALWLIGLLLLISGLETVSAEQSQEILGKDKAPMVLVPEGVFPMGVPSAARDGGVDERPTHDVFLDTFYIDKYELTNGRYLQFVIETGHRTPQHPTDPTKGIWQGNIMPESIIDLPVINVDWFDAEAYCTWAGKRLPTEAEWEKAAKGPNDWRFPWGDVEPTDKHLNYNQVTWRGESTLVPVGIYEAGKSPYGAYDMAGNVWEWVADWYDSQYYSKSPERNPKGPQTGDYKVLRSSGWQGETPQARIFTRIMSKPLDRNHSTGFRCAKGLEKVSK